MQDKNPPQSVIHREASARLWGELKGRLSSFNISQIISLTAILLFVVICLVFAGTSPSLLAFLKPLVIALSVLFFLVVVGGSTRNAFIKPQDEFSPVITKFMQQHKAVEIRGLPSSTVTAEFIGEVSSVIFLENPPPEGVIEGDVTDDKSIRLLTEQEKEAIKVKEHQEIEQHIKKKLLEVKRKADAVKESLPPPESTKQVDSR